MERKLQSEIIKWLRFEGAYVIKVRVSPGVAIGCPDIIALYGPKHTEIEVKASSTAPFRIGQKATLQHLKKGNRYVYVAYPENWPLIKQDLKTHFF